MSRQCTRCNAPTQRQRGRYGKLKGEWFDECTRCLHVEPQQQQAQEQAA